MKRFSYRERDYAFGQLMLTLRTTIGLTQAGLAEQLGVSRRAVAEWEAGSNYPKAQRLKAFIALGVRASAFPAGREAEEVRALWKAARQKVMLDEQWLAVLLSQQRPPSPFAISGSIEQRTARGEAVVQSASGPRVDWGEALAVPSFYGREEELATLTQWVVQARCRLVSVLGQGGIGKSALAVTLMHRLAPHFQVVIWRSLRDAPGCSSLLADCLQVLAPQPLAEVPADLEGRLSLVLEYLRNQRALLVLDNLETLLADGEGTGRLRANSEGYARLLRRVAQSDHQSCLLLTSREKPGGLVHLEGNQTPVRSLRLEGLARGACEQLIAEQALGGSLHERQRLIERYVGNPLALKIVGRTIADLFGGAIAPFLTGDEVVFGGVRELLDEQFARLSAGEQTVLLWLAILREPVTIGQIHSLLGVSLSRMQVLQAVEALRRRSLVERGKQPGSFTLQSVVQEYVTARLIAEATGEIEQGRLDRLLAHGLELATSREYVRQTQQRLIVRPLLAQVRRLYRRREEVEERLLSLLAGLRARADYAQGYGPSNLLVLLREQRGHLRGLDLSQLTIRGASLQGVEMQDANLSGATLQDSVFTETFDATWAVVISGSGRYWAAGVRQGEVRVWRERGQILHLAWQAHTSMVMTLAFSPDERRLATGSWDGAIKLWDLERGTLLWTGWHTASVNYVTFTHDGRVVASGGNDAVIQLWDVASGSHLQTLAHQGGSIHSLACSPDGKLLASGGFDGSIRLWDLSITQPEMFGRLLTGHTNYVSGLAFAPDGETLASTSWDRTIKLWDIDSLSVRQTLVGHTDWVFRLAWSPNGRLLASCGRDRMVWLWDVEQRSCRTVLHGHSAVVHDVAFTPDSRNLLSGSEDGTLRVWEMESGQCVRVMQGYAVSLNDIDWLPPGPSSSHGRGSRLASAGSDTLVTIWDVEGQTPPRVLRGHRWIVYGVAWSPDGRLLASSGWDSSVRVWDVTTETCVKILQAPDGVATGFYGIAWSPDGQWLSSGSYQEGVHVWEVATGTCQWVRGGQPIRTRFVAWSPDGARLAGGNGDGSVCLWEASEGTLLQRLQGHRGLVASVAWSPDGTRLASGGGSSGKGELFVWDARSGERLHTLNEPSEIVFALAWSLTSAMLVSGGSDGVLRWWHLQHGECVRVRKAHQGAVQSLKLSSDGQWLASCGYDGAINIWDMESGEHLRTLRRDRPYERLDISGVKGLTEAQRASLRALGAIEESAGTRL